MNKIKYKFNTKSLTYEKDTIPLLKRVWQGLSYLATGLVFATFSIVFAYNYADSPKEIQLKREIYELTQHYDYLNKRLNDANEILVDIQERDNNVYRTIFEAEPIPLSVRKGGFGGAEKYKELRGFDNSDLMIETSKRLDMLTKQLYVQSKSFDEVAKLVKNKEKLLAAIPAIQPVSNKDLKRLASGYGWRTHPIYKTQKFHAGMDFSATTGTEIFATGDGVIEKAQEAGQGYGLHVVINHGYGYTTLYAHMSKFAVKAGQHVKRGQLIGYVGNTGLSTGPHVHYEVRKNNEILNPVNYYYNDVTPEQYKRLVEMASQSTQSFD